ncbi:MAG: hypothetical protein OCD01_16540 [Fibrobacterales bacterium]
MYQYLLSFILVALIVLSACDRNIVKPKLDDSDSTTGDLQNVQPQNTVSSQAVVVQGSSSSVGLPGTSVSSATIEAGSSSHNDSTVSSNSGDISSSMPSVSSSAGTSLSSELAATVSSSENALSSSVSSSAIHLPESSSSELSVSSSSVAPVLKTFQFYAEQSEGTDEFKQIGRFERWGDNEKKAGPDAAEGNKSIKFEFTDGGWASVFDSQQDFRQFDKGYLHFDIKTTTNAAIKIEWDDDANDSKTLFDYTGLSGDWEHVVIPLDSFHGINLEQLREPFALIYLNGGKREKIVIDNIYYSTQGTSTYRDRGGLVIMTDDYNGSDYFNALGKAGNWGALDLNDIRYSSDRTEGEKSIALTPGEGGYTLAYDSPTDLREWAQGKLVFDVKTEHNYAIKIEWGDINHKTETAYIGLDQYVRADNHWQTAVIPFDHFANEFGGGIQFDEIKIPFGLHKGEGTVLIDNIRWVK